MTLLDRIARYPSKPSRSEQLLVNYLVSHYPQGALQSATSIAGLVHVSPATVVRFVNKLGYQNFGELQDEVRDDVSVRFASPAGRADNALKSPRSLVETLDHAFRHDAENLAATRAGLDVGSCAAMVDLLCRRSLRVSVIGAKNSAPLAAYLAIHLNMCRPDVRLLDADPAHLADHLIWTGKKDLLLAVSVRRYSPIVLQTARQVAQGGGQVLAITDSGTSPLAKIAQHNLVFSNANVAPFDSFSAGMTLSNALISAVASKVGTEVTEALRRGEAHWKKLGVVSEPE